MIRFFSQLRFPTLGDKFQYWIKILIKFMSVQLVVQVLGFASGLLIIRSLNKTQYTYFIIANTFQSTIDLMSDFGITIGLNSIGGQVYKDQTKFSQLIRTAFSIRRYLIVITTALVSPILFVILSNKGAGFYQSILLILAILVELQFYSINKILVVVPRLNSRINQIQQLDLITSFTRLIGLLTAYILGLNVVIAAFCSTVASGVQSFFLSKWTKEIINPNTTVNLEYQHKIWNLIKTQFLPTTFFCFQGQITIWLISIFGSTNTTAEIGALSRLGVIVTLINPVINSIIAPGYARLDSIKILKIRYCQLILVFLAISVCLLLLVLPFSRQVVWILGSQYAHLNNEVIFILANSLTNSLTNMIWALNYSRSWVSESWMTIPSTIMMQVLLLFFLDVSTVRGVILFSLFSSTPALCTNLYMSISGMKRFVKL